MATKKRVTRAEATVQVKQSAADASRLGGPTKKARKHQRSPKDRANELQLQRSIFQLVVRGATLRQISEQLNIGLKRAGRLQARALDEYLADRNELVHLRMAKSFATIDSMFRTWVPRATGYFKKVDNEDVWVEPDPKAAHIVDRYVRSNNMLIGYGVSVKVEHTGAAGGPIMTAHLDARAAAAMFREGNNANAPQVFLDEGESIDDVPTLASHHH